MITESYKMFTKRLAEFETKCGVVSPELKNQLREFYIKGTLDGLVLPVIMHNRSKGVDKQ